MGSMQKLFEDGHLYHRDRKYELALESFSKALVASKYASYANKISILEGRCAIYVKLANLESALRDSKAIIHLDKKDPRGYIRCSQVEKLRGAYSAAIKWIEHGISNVPATHALHRSMQDQLQALQRIEKASIVYQKPRDPIDILPIELIQMTLSCLEYRQVVQLLKVSKKWRKLLIKLAPLTTTLDLRGLRRQIMPATLTVLLSRITRPKLIAVDQLPNKTECRLQAWLEKRARLAEMEEFYLNSSCIYFSKLDLHKNRLKRLTLGGETVVDIQFVLDVLTRLQHIEEAVFENTRNVKYQEPSTQQTRLRKLKIIIRHDNPGAEITSFWTRWFPQLHHLTLRRARHDESLDNWDFASLSELTFLDVSGSCPVSITLPPSLETLLWHSWMGPYLHLPDFLHTSAEPLNMHTLGLNGFYGSTILHYLEQCKLEETQIKRAVLREMHLGSFEVNGLTANHSRVLSGVETLLYGSQTLNDSHAECFAQCFRAVQDLTLEETYMVTGAFVADLVKRSGNRIRSVTLINCSGVSSDIIEWGHARDVTVQIKRHEHPTRYER